MKFFEWLNGPYQTEVERALSMLKKHKVYHKLNSSSHDHVMIGTYKFSIFNKTKRSFPHLNVKFSKNGENAMISSRGTVDFFFSSKEEVDQLRKGIAEHFGVTNE